MHYADSFSSRFELNNISSKKKLCTFGPNLTLSVRSEPNQGLRIFSLVIGLIQRLTKSMSYHITFKHDEKILEQVN